MARKKRTMSTDSTAQTKQDTSEDTQTTESSDGGQSESPETPTQEESSAEETTQDTPSTETSSVASDAGDPFVSQTPQTDSVESSTPSVQTPSVPVDPTAPVKQKIVKEAPVATAQTPEPVAAPAPVTKAPPAVQAEVVSTPVNVTSTTPLDDDDENVAKLKVMLEAFKTKNKVPGKHPEDFVESAKATATITQFVIKYPKQPVLNTLLAFFIENKKGVCDGKNFMKGSTTLPPVTEQKVGFLYAIFADMANQRFVRINSSLLVQILGKPEILEFYNKKMNALKR